ncbi:chromogranin-A-like [Conger conger]|uniref:chromogranin-A-like n=1 Tax=Conger conger TaxID=82655 RepID=UPI002A5AE93B|nr:chromogranin-A-like [Conger conger]
MITRGCYVFTLLVSYVLSIPVPSDQVEKDDIKVMKCIVEVIADSLNKPHPIAISQECQDSLTGDDRIASILRHQNLLKELQEIAAQGVSERVLHSPQKKSGEDSDQVTNALGGHPGAEDTTDRDRLNTDTGLEHIRSARAFSVTDLRYALNGIMGQGTRRRRRRGCSAKPGRGEAGGRGGGEEGLGRGGEEKKEEETHSSSGEDEGKGKEGNGTEEDDSTQVSQDGEAEPLKAVPEAESQEKGSKQEEEVEEEEEMEGEPEDKKSSEGAEKESEEEATKREEESPREPSEGAGGDVRVGPEGGNPMEEKQGAPQLLWYAPRHSKENSEEVERRSPEAQELHMMAHGEAEEGSASHRGEDHEIARLAAIESELESVAQRLHELRRG